MVTGQVWAANIAQTKSPFPLPLCFSAIPCWTSLIFPLSHRLLSDFHLRILHLFIFPNSRLSFVCRQTTKITKSNWNQETFSYLKLKNLYVFPQRVLTKSSVVACYIHSLAGKKNQVKKKHFSKWLLSFSIFHQHLSRKLWLKLQFLVWHEKKNWLLKVYQIIFF